MSILGRVRITSAERLDLPDILAIDSYVGGDFKFLLKSLVGDSKPFVLKGFDIIDPNTAVGTKSCAVRIAESAAFFPGSKAGSFFYGLPEGDPNAAPLIPELRNDAINYVYVTFTTFDTGVDSRAFWDPDANAGAGGEYSQDIETETTLTCQVNVSVGAFPANTLAIAKVKTDASGTIEWIEDARNGLFRLGEGGIVPNPYSNYNWRSLPGTTYKRDEPPTVMTAGGDNPFQGGDKNIYTLKEWMDVVMTKLKELGGTTFWYEDASTYSMINNFIDSLATTFKSKGQWTHSNATPGLVSWSEDLQFKMTADPRMYILRSGNFTLSNEEVAYLELIRNAKINDDDQIVSWVTGANYVNTYGGSIGLFANLQKGDWIRRIDDPNQFYLRVEEFYDTVNATGIVTTPANAKSVRLSSTYQGTTKNEKARFDRGEYLSADVNISARDQAVIGAIGGNFSWLALRSDVEMKISNISTTTLTVNITDHDGNKAKVTSAVPHGLEDGDRVVISGSTNFNGINVVEVESSTVFYIEETGGVFTDELSVTASYAIVTTTSRDNGYSFQLENNSHGLNSNDTVVLSSTTNYNGSYQVRVRSSSEFNIAVAASLATESTGLMNLAKVNVRAEQGVFNLVQGESGTIGDDLTNNVKLFLGMESDSQTFPSYHVTPSYNALDGQQNFNSSSSDNVTERLSKLSAMMADKAQDKTIKYIPSGLTSIINTTNGSAQELTFLPAGATLTLLQSGGLGNAVVTLPSTSPGISLLAGQVAYVSIDRNASSTPSIQVAYSDSLEVNENVFVIASRISGADCYAWDDTQLYSGTNPVFMLGAHQDRNAKLIKGGAWNWDLASTTLAWPSDAYIQIPGIADNRNTILTGSNTALTADDMCLYVTINRIPGASTNLTISSASIASVPNTHNTLIIARRVGNDVLVGNGTILLIDGESKYLEAGLSEENKTLLGSNVTEATFDPDYSSRGAVNRITSNTEGVLDAIARHDAEFDKYFGQFRMIAKTAGNKKRIRITGSDRITFTGETITQETGGLRISFSGAEIDFSTGAIYGGDATLPLSTDFTTPLGVNFTPPVIPAGNYLWYSVAANPSGTNPDGTMNVQFTILAANTSDTTPTLAVKPALGGTKKLGFVVVKSSGLNIYDFDDVSFTLPAASAQSKVAQLGMGSGSGGSASPKMVGGGTFSWAGTVLTFTSDFYIEQPRLNYTDNTISQATYGVGFINLPTTNHVAYIERLNASSGQPNPVLLVDLITNVRDGQLIIARRDGTDVIVGSTSTRLKQGQSSKLFQQSSDQTLIYTGQPDTADSSPLYTNVTNPLASYDVVQGDDLTFAIGQTIGNVNDILSTMDNPSYDEYYSVVAGGGLTTIVSQTAGTSTYPIDANTSTIGQSFVAPSNGSLDNIKVLLSISGSPFCDLQLELRADNLGVPGSLIATSGTTPSSFIPTFPISGLSTFYFSSLPALVSGTTYWFTLKLSNIVTLDVTNFIRFWNASANPYAPGMMATSVNSGILWSTSPSIDLYMEIDASSLGYHEIPAQLSGSTITIPANSRLIGSPQQNYVVGKGALELYLNGQYLAMGATNGWSEVGVTGSNSSQIMINQDLIVGDMLQFRLDANGGPSSGGSAPDDNFYTLGTSATPDNSDYILTYDASSLSYKKQLRSVFLSGLGGMPIVATYTSNHTADVNNDDVILVNAVSNNITITLPLASSATGKIFYIKKIDVTANIVDIQTSGGDQIDGAANIPSVSSYESFTLVSSGSAWWIL